MPKLTLGNTVSLLLLILNLLSSAISVDLLCGRDLMPDIICKFIFKFLKLKAHFEFDFIMYEFNLSWGNCLDIKVYSYITRVGNE